MEGGGGERKRKRREGEKGVRALHRYSDVSY